MSRSSCGEPCRRMSKDQQVTRTRTRQQNTRQQNKPLTRTQSEQRHNDAEWSKSSSPTSRSSLSVSPPSDDPSPSRPAVESRIGGYGPSCWIRGTQKKIRVTPSNHVWLALWIQSPWMWTYLCHIQGYTGGIRYSYSYGCVTEIREYLFNT